MNMGELKLALVVGFSVLSAPAFAGSPSCSVYDPAWENQHDSTQSKIANAVDDYSAAVAVQNQTKIGRAHV